MNRFCSKQFIPICTALLAILWIFTGTTNYGFWKDATGPTQGFVPIIIATIMLAVSVLTFIQSLKEDGPIYPSANWMVVLSGFAIFALTFLVGMLPTLALYVILWLRVYEKASWASTLRVFAIIMTIVVGAFVFWLGVPFPKGMLFTALLG